MSNKITAAGLELVKHFEGRYLKAYNDRPDSPAAGTWTIGYGVIFYPPWFRDGSPVREGDVITAEECDALLPDRLEAEGEHYVKAWIKVPLTDAQYSALSSFTFNRGAGRFHERLVAIINTGDFLGAANVMLTYNWAYNKVTKREDILPGLTRRRYAEREMFLGGNWEKYRDDGVVSQPVPPQPSLPDVPTNPQPPAAKKGKK